MTSYTPPAGQKLLTGGFELVIQEDAGVFGYCRNAWGNGSCVTRTCSSGPAAIIGLYHDKISPAEDLSPNKVVSKYGSAHVNLMGCLQ